MKRTKKPAVCAVCAALMLLSGCGDAAKNVELGSFITKENVQNINFATIYPKEGEYFNYFAVIDDAHTAVISYYETAEYTDFNTFVIYENGKRVYEKQISNRFDSLCYDSENDCFYSHNNSDDKFYRLDREFNITGTVAENIHLFYTKSSLCITGSSGSTRSRNSQRRTRRKGSGNCRKCWITAPLATITITAKQCS